MTELRGQPSPSNMIAYESRAIALCKDICGDWIGRRNDQTARLNLETEVYYALRRLRDEFVKRGIRVPIINVNVTRKVIDETLSGRKIYSPYEANIELSCREIC